MNSFEKYEDMLADYIAGRLTDEERRELEVQLESSEELREALEDTRMMAVGLSVMDAITAGHIESELLVAYAAGPALDETTRRNIEKHLGECAECREELNLCRIMPDEDTAQDRSLFHSIMEWFLAPRLVLRPAYVAAALFVLALPLLYFAGTFGPERSARAEFVLESASRDVRNHNEFVVERGAEVIHLEFLVPTISNRTYDINLHDSNGRMIFSRPGNPAQNQLAVDVPTSYLQSDRYQLRVIELGAGIEPMEIQVFDFRVQFSDN